MIEINEDLTLNFIEDNLVRENKLVSVEMSFTFFGKHYLAYLKVDSLDTDRLVYPMVEGSGKLLEAFEEELESKEVEKVIRENVKQHVLQFDLDEDEWINRVENQ